MKQISKSKVKTNSKELVPAFGEGPYLARLSSRSALASELKILLAAASEKPKEEECRQLILEGNCLAKSSESSRRRVWEDLSSRYLLRPSHPLFQCFLAEWSKYMLEPEKSLLLYCLWALNDRLVADLGVKYLFPRLRQAPSPLSPDDVVAHLFAERDSHPELTEWSSATTATVSRKYLASVRDYGLARGIYSKTSVRPALYAAPARLLIRALRLTKIKDFQIISSPWFRLIGLDSHEVIDGLSELSRQGRLEFRMQADVVELDLERHEP